MDHRHRAEPLKKQWIDIILEKIRVAWMQDPSNKVSIYFSLTDILWFKLWDPEFGWENAFTYIDNEFNEYPIFKSLETGKPMRSKEQLLRFDWYDDLVGSYMASIPDELIPDFSYLWYGPGLWEESYNHLETADSKTNKYTSYFRGDAKFPKGSAPRWNIAGQRYFVTKERLVFHVWYWEVHLSDSFVLDLMSQTNTECYNVWNKLIVNIDKSTFTINGVTKKVGKNNKSPVPKYWMDLTSLVRWEKIVLGNFPLGSNEQIAFDRRYRNLSKFLNKVSWHSLLSISWWELKLTVVVKKL